MFQTFSRLLRVARHKELTFHMREYNNKFLYSSERFENSLVSISDENRLIVACNLGIMNFNLVVHQKTHIVNYSHWLFNFKLVS